MARLTVTLPGSWPMPIGAELGRFGFARALIDVLRGRVLIYDRSRALSVDLELDEAAAAALMPACLKLSSPARGTLILLDHPMPAFCDPYREAILAVEVRGLYGRGMHFVWMTVDDDTALLTGREWLGCPKKMASVAFRETESGVTAEVVRHGVRVLSIVAEKRPTEACANAPVFGRRTYTIGGPGHLVWWSSIWSYAADETVHATVAMSATVEWGSAPRDPIAPLLKAPGMPLTARLQEFSVTRGRPLLFAGFSGMEWFGRTYDLRYR